MKPVLPISAPPPSFADIAKASNDLINKDFYHANSANLEIKSKAPNGVSFNVKGKSSHEGSTSGSLEGKFAHKESGTTTTISWNTQNALDTKIELDNQIASGVKAELLTTFLPHAQDVTTKLNLHYKQPSIHTRAFFNLRKGPIANIDFVLGQQGFLVGAEAGYDVQKAAITGYQAAVGYQTPVYSAAVTATNNVSVFAASYYHKMNSLIEAGAKATWDSKAGKNVGLEIASKYRLDASSFAKAKINDRGIASLGYSVVVRNGFTLGVGASFNTQNLEKAEHKIGAQLVFEN